MKETYEVHETDARVRSGRADCDGRNEPKNQLNTEGHRSAVANIKIQANPIDTTPPESGGEDSSFLRKAIAPCLPSVGLHTWPAGT